MQWPFSFRGPKEIEGVELGWYSYHKGGYGLLDEVKFVFDGSPKSFHNPNHPEVGNLGWTEGWMQFNTAFYASMPYLANYYSWITLENSEEELIISLNASLNFDPDKNEPVQVMLSNKVGQSIWVKLEEESPYSELYVGRVIIHNSSVESNGKLLTIQKDDELRVQYGYGFMKKIDLLKIKR